MFFAFGPIREAADIASGSFGLFATVNVAAAVVLALLSKTVRKYKFEIAKDNPDAAYEKDLAKREGVALERFTLVATGALAVMGIGYTLYSFFLGGFAIEPVTFSLFAAVWLVAGGFQARWVDGLTSDKKLQERINNFEHIVGFTSTALALNAWVHSIDNLWLGVLGTAALAFVAVILGAKFKRVAAHPKAVLTAQYSLIASWLVWYIPDNTLAGDLLLALGALLVLFGFSLLLQQWFRKRVVWQAVSDYIKNGGVSDEQMNNYWTWFLDYMWQCPAEERSLSGMMAPKSDAKEFRSQIDSIYNFTMNLLTGFSNSK